MKTSGAKARGIEENRIEEEQEGGDTRQTISTAAALQLLYTSSSVEC